MAAFYQKRKLSGCILKALEVAVACLAATQQVVLSLGAASGALI